MFKRIRSVYRYLMHRCLDCGKALSKEYDYGDVCDSCFDSFNGLTIEKMCNINAEEMNKKWGNADADCGSGL